MTGVAPNASHLEPLFRLEVLKMLKREGKITDAVIENMDTWHHNGFHVYCGNAIRFDDEEGLERLAQYVIRAPISQERMLYIPAAQTGSGVAQVVYTGKNSRVYHTDPLQCPKCNGSMRIISFIEEEAIIEPIHQMPFEDAYSQVSPYDDQEF